jgi:hypothetical protein
MFSHLILLATLFGSATCSYFPLTSSLLSGRRGGTSGWDAVRTQCEESLACANIGLGGEQGCVSRCMSPRCSRRAYGPSGLEQGESPGRERAADFRKCLRASERPLKRASLWPPRLADAGASGAPGSLALVDSDEVDEVYFAFPDAKVDSTSNAEKSGHDKDL